MKKEILKNFYVLEGGDGAGTTTQMDLLEGVVKTFEPTDGPIGRLIRQVQKSTDGLTLKHDTLARLYAADRHEHIETLIRPKCAEGIKVISDRYALSSYAYQTLFGATRVVKDAHRGIPHPQMYIFFDIPPQKAFQRVKKRNMSLEFWERLEFQERVYKNYMKYLDVFAKEGVDVQFVDATQSIEDLHVRVKQLIFGNGQSM